MLALLFVQSVVELWHNIPYLQKAILEVCAAILGEIGKELLDNLLVVGIKFGVGQFGQLVHVAEYAVGISQMLVNVFKVIQYYFCP